MRAVFVLFVFMKISCFSQIVEKENKNNYLTYPILLNSNLEKLFFSDNIINSNFILNGKIKTLTIIDSSFQSKEQIHKKYYFDHKRNITRVKKFDVNGLETSDIKYFYYSPIFNYDINIIKEGYLVSKKSKSKYSRDLEPNVDEGNYEYKSIHVEQQNLIIVNTFRSKELIGIDSIYYVDGFKPNSITKSDRNGIIQRRRILEYSRENISLNIEIFYKGRKIDNGQKYYYDYKNNESYYKKLYDINQKTYKYKVRDDTSFHLKPYEKGFILQRGKGRSLVYDQELKIMTNYYSSSSTFIFHFLDNNLPYLEERIRNGSLRTYKSYEYNDYDDIVLETFHNVDREDDTEKYQYKYDSSNNWIQKNIYVNGSLTKIIKRSIEYY